MKNYKLPEHYFCMNDLTPGFEVEECIIQECESAGLEITEDEYDSAESCTECHDPDEGDEEVPKRADAFHQQCAGCHEDFGAGPVEKDCAACHVM